MFLAMTIFGWFKEYQLYQIAVIYMSSRFFNNISQSYLPLFLQNERNGIERSHLYFVKPNSNTVLAFFLKKQ